MNEFPNFNDDGYLPKGCHEFSIEEFHKVFVDSFKISKTRLNRFICFLEFYRFFLEHFDLITDCIIFGSYITTKINPFDVDMLFVLDWNNVEFPTNMHLYNLEECVRIIKLEYLKLDDAEKLESDFHAFGCDFHYLHKRSKNENDELYQDYIEKRRYWLKWMSNGGKTGLVSIPCNYGEVLCNLEKLN